MRILLDMTGKLAIVFHHWYIHRTLTGGLMNDWRKELTRCKVATQYREIDIFWVEDHDYHQHVDVYGRVSPTSNFEQIGDSYCHGFYIWACDCQDHDDPDIIAGWCKVPRHAIQIIAGEISNDEFRTIGVVTITRITEANHPKLNINAICYQLRIPNMMLFEIYDKPYNVGMVIIKPVKDVGIAEQ